jgi:prolyl-tRNA editing enzyme YbaK/EbsC (Cys-tRNA(Pro) deacylase)
VLVCDGAYVLALVPGDRRVSEQAVAEAVPARSVRVASSEEVTLATGFEPGAVAPFPRRAVRDTLMETSFFAHETVWIGAGSSAHMASLRPGELQRLAGARAVDLIGPG